MDLFLRGGIVIYETKNRVVIYRPTVQNFIVVNKLTKKIDFLSTTKQGAIALAENRPLY